MRDVINHRNALGDRREARQLLPLIYDELRRLAAQKLARERAGQTLEPAALVHEAYVRLVVGRGHDGRQNPLWDSRGHFFAAMAESMRRILIEDARRNARVKHGGGRQRVDLDERELSVELVRGEASALEEALAELAAAEPAAAQVVQLRFFSGLSIEKAAVALGVSRATAYRQWTYARTWLRSTISGEADLSLG